MDDREFPACECARCASGVPTATLIPVPPPTAPRSLPPSIPYRPTTRGETVFDTRTGQWGVFMGWHHGVAYLRPTSGGIEWDTDAYWLSDRSAR